MKRKRKSERQPCQKCGGEKLPGQGQKYCQDCADAAHWAEERKRHTRVIRDRQPCQICGGVKEPGHGRKWCARCTQARKPVRICMHCPAVVQAPKRLCPTCKAEALAKKRAEDNERHKRYRREHPKPKRKPLTDAQKQDVRINYRLRVGETGGRRNLSEAAYFKRYGNGSGRKGLPLEPLRPYLLMHDEHHIAAELGIKLSRLTEGERISLRTADRICTFIDVPLTLVYGDMPVTIAGQNPSDLADSA